MNIKNFVLACQMRRFVAIVLDRDDFEQLRQAMRAAGPDIGPDWNVEQMRYRGAPIERSEWGRSYLIEDTPDGPMIHMLN